MPGGNQTGPSGEGPMTGRGLGSCGGGAGGRPGRGGRMFRGRGRGPGGGGGRGHRNWYHATGLTWWQRATRGFRGLANPLNSKDETAALRDEANYHEGALAEIKQRLDEVEDRSETER